MIIGEWGRRFFRHAAGIATGVIGLVILAALDIADVFPVDWLAYAILAAVALALGSYMAFEDLWKEYQQEKANCESAISGQKARTQELQDRIREIETRRPNVSVGFQDDTGHLVKRMKFELRPLPESPDLDSLIEEKRRRLLGRQPAAGSPSALVNWTNSQYLNEVEQYLLSYRPFLHRQYEYRLALDRTRFIVPAVENSGNSTATALQVELFMPEAYEAPLIHQFHPDLRGLEEIRGYSVEELRELKEIGENILLDAPQEPQPFNGWQSVMEEAFGAVRYLSPPTSSVISSTQESDNTDGPVEETRNGSKVIVYKVERLVQGRREDAFEPLWMWLGGIKHSVIWEIPIRITCAELPEAQGNILTLDISVSKERGS